MGIRYLVCLDETPAGDGTCASTAWVESPTFLPPLPIEDATTIAVAFLTAFVAVQVVKIVARKTQ